MSTSQVNISCQHLMSIFQLDFPFLMPSISQYLEFNIYDCYFWVGFPVSAVKYFSNLSPHRVTCPPPPSATVHQVGKCIPEKLWRNCPDWRMTNMPKRLTAKIQFFQSRISFHSHGDFLHLITGQTNSLDGLYFSPPCHFHSTGQCHVLAFFKNKLFILPQLRVLSNTFPPLAHQHSRLEVTKR